MPYYSNIGVMKCLQNCRTIDASPDMLAHKRVSFYYHGDRAKCKKGTRNRKKVITYSNNQLVPTPQTEMQT